MQLSGLLLIAFAVLHCPPPQGSGTLRLHVDANAVGGANDGSSWANAFRGSLGLQNALAAVATAASAELWVANGTYTPGPVSAGTAAHFELRDGRHLRRVRQW